MKNLTSSPKWYERIPHAVTILFGIIVLVTIMTYVIPAGTYERELVNGRNRVIPGSYQELPSSPIGLLGMFEAVPLGFRSAVDIIFIVLAGGIMFGLMEKSQAVENSVGSLVKLMGPDNKYLLVVIMTFVFGFLGVAVGYENNIAMVPIAAVLSLAIGGDLILAAGISAGAMTVGFGLSPINPYTVGTGHNLAELPLYSGAGLRTVLCFLGLSMMAWVNVRYLKRIIKDPVRSLGKGLDEEGMALSRPISSYSMTAANWLVILIFLLGLAVILYGIKQFQWHIVELSAIFLMIGLASGLVSGMRATDISNTVLEGVSKAAPGAFMVGYATTIKVLMEQGKIADTISNSLANMLEGLPLYLAAISMSLSQCVINLFIPSGSGQALATLPVMLPLGEVLGLTNQTTILAFQIGDGVTNLINPTLGGLIAMLALCRVPLDRWLRFIFPLMLMVLAVSWVTLLVAVAIGYS
ncbi:MAG: AbgT family transporter [Bacteroidota bacterium]